MPAGEATTQDTSTWPDRYVPTVPVNLPPGTTVPLTANLSCEVHPILARKYWFSISDDEYEELQSALQLATMLMNTPAYLGFYATMLFAPRAIDSIQSRSGNYVVRGHTSGSTYLTPLKAERIKDMFNELEGVFTFTSQVIVEEEFAYTVFTFRHDLTNKEHADLEWRRNFDKTPAWSARMSLKHGMTVDLIEGEEQEFCWPDPEKNSCIFEDDRWKPIQDPRTRMTLSTIVLSAQLLARLRAKRQCAENKLRFNFFVAAIILHELAHAVEFGRPERRELSATEAMFPGEEMPELGHQVIKQVFGGIPYEEEIDEWLHFEWQEDGTRQVCVVPMDYVARVQRQECWDLVSPTDLSHLELLYIPTTITTPDPIDSMTWRKTELDGIEDFWDR